MRIGKYCLDITEFEWLPWQRVEFDEDEILGYAYVFRGWLWFVISHSVDIGNE
jgi:hypothetical protein